MDMINAKPVTVYPIVQWLPKLVPFAVLAAIIVSSATLMHSTWRKVFGAVLIGGLVFYVVKVPTDGVFAHILASIEYLDPANRFNPPYDYHIVIPAYFSFAEPVAASFAVGLLTWDQLSRHSLTRIAQLALLILLAHGPVFRPFINIFYAKTDAATANAERRSVFVRVNCARCVDWCFPHLGIQISLTGTAKAHLVRDRFKTSSDHGLQD